MDDNSCLERIFRFAVVDFCRSKSFPQNFVCMLPVQLGVSKSDSVFLQVFKDKSLEQAKVLLRGVLKTEDDFEVKTEIERRLGLLEPKVVSQVK